MKFLAFAASHRPESLNKKLLLLAVKRLHFLGVEVEFVEYRNFDMAIYNDNLANNPPEEAFNFAKKLADIDGIIIATPEYNWSFPGSLKNIIDWTSRIKPNPMSEKTAFLMSATTGMRGGIVGMQQLKLPLEAQNMFIFNKVFPLSYAHTAFTETGELADKDQQELFFTIVKDYIIFTKKLLQK